MAALEASRYKDHLDDSDLGVTREEGYFKKPVLPIVEKSYRLDLMISDII